MHYEINVAEKLEDGRFQHVFCTADRSITTIGRLRTVHQMLKEAFPEPRFAISCYRVITTYTNVDPTLASVEGQ